MGAMPHADDMIRIGGEAESRRNRLLFCVAKDGELQMKASIRAVVQAWRGANELLVNLLHVAYRRTLEGTKVG